MSSRRFAFFDLDLTLVPFDTQLLFCNHVLQAEGWRRVLVLFSIPFLPLYGAGLISDLVMKRIFLSYLWRMRRETLERHVGEFVGNEFPGVVYGEVAREVERHRAEGRITVLSTASPLFYAAAMAKKLGFDDCYATRVVVGDRMKVFPRIEPPNNKGEGKIQSMRAILPEGAGRGAAPLEDCYAYSDSSADLPMLGLAEHVVMVHPSPRLRREGEKHGWKELRPERPYAGTPGRLVASVKQLLGIWRAA